jgi:hypothetical protein
MSLHSYKNKLHTPGYFVGDTTQTFLLSLEYKDVKCVVRRRRCRRLYLLSSHVSRLVHRSTTFYSTYIRFFTVHYYVFTVQVVFNDYYAFISTFYCTYISF